MSGCERPGCVNPDDPEDRGGACSDCLHDADEVREALANAKALGNGPSGFRWLIGHPTRDAILRLIARAEK